LFQLNNITASHNNHAQEQINQIPKSCIRADLAVGLGLCMCILLALSGLHLWKTDIYKKRFNTLIEQQRSFSLCGRISLELEQQSQFLLSLVYQNNPGSKEKFYQSRERIIDLMQNAQAGKRLHDGITETIRLQLLKLQQISRNLAKTAEHIFDLLDRGEIDEAQKRVELFVWPILENEIQKQALFFVDKGRENFEHAWEKWRQKEKILAVISNAVVIVSLLAILFISINLAKKILRAEHEILKISEEKYRSIFDNSLDGIYRSTPEGRFIDVNPALVKMLGYESKEELLSIYIPKDLYFSESDRPTSTERNRIFLTRFKRKDGAAIRVEVNSRAFFDKERNAIYHEGIVRDTTRRDGLEKRLRQAQKMGAIGTLAGGIAHDFNNILTPILGYTEMSINNLPDDSKASQYLAQVQKAGERARDLVSQILAFSRQTEGKQKPIQLVPIVKEVLKLLQATLPATIEIHQNIAKDTCIVNAEPTQMHQILMNLCTNAGHAMAEGGVLEISLVNVELNEEFCAKYEGLRAGHHVRLTVTDTGCGMDQEILPRVFEPFFTTKGPDKGTGMGLSVVHGIVKSHNGHISVYSEPGIGTTVHIYLPVVESIAGTLPETAEPAQQGSESILFVDDEPMIVDMGRETLKRLGYSVTTKTGSIKALELFRMKPMEFDLVITDQTMPQMTGTDLAKEILHIRPSIPIILCTGFSNTINSKNMGIQGIREFVMKPIVGAELGRVVRRALDEEPSRSAGQFLA
jgi:PAS domain S-box-containing protein